MVMLLIQALHFESYCLRETIMHVPKRTRTKNVHHSIVCNCEKLETTNKEMDE